MPHGVIAHLQVSANAIFAATLAEQLDMLRLEAHEAQQAALAELEAHLNTVSSEATMRALENQKAELEQLAMAGLSDERTTWQQFAVRSTT